MIPDLCVIVPVFNEENSVATFHAGLTSALSEAHIKYEIIYVNDGSTDSSAKQLARINNVMVLSHDRNRGYGAAIKTGLRYAKTNTIAIIDCDGTYSTNDLAKLYQHMNDCDMVIGVRPQKNNLNSFSKRILRSIASYAVDYPIPDLNSGLRIFKREVSEQLFSMLPNGFSLTSTMTLGGLYNPFRVRFIPIEYNQRTGKSKIKPMKAFFGFTMLIFRTMVLFNPLKFFLPPAGLFALIGLGFLIRDIIALDIAQTSVLMLVNAFLCLAIGLLAEAIRNRP
jgi:glycosyltransferase involved in cell wall biosynthesis